MESLPTELLLEVLSLAASGSHGAMLVESVPLVCRRWRDAARDPRCWAGVDAAVLPTPAYFNPKHVSKDHVLLARARYIRSLRLGASGSVDEQPRFTVAILDGALRVSRAQVQRLAVQPAVWRCLTNEGCASLLRLVWRSRWLLRSAQVYVDSRALRRSSPSPPNPCSDCVNPSLRLRLLEVLAVLPRLEELRLVLEEDDLSYYDGELATMLARRLRLLEVTVDISVYDRPVYPDALLDDLLRCGAASLEDVAVSGWWQPGKPTLRLLAACEKLTRLAAHPAFLAAGALDSVETLLLDICVDPEAEEFYEGPLNSPDMKVVEWVKEALDRRRPTGPADPLPGPGRCKTMKSLKTLTVQVSFDGTVGLAGARKKRALADAEYKECCQHLSDFSARRPSVELKFIVSGELKLTLPKA